MMNTNKKTPKLRFKGFTDDWEQRKLNDFGIATGGTSIESEFVDGGTYKVINIGSYSEESVYNDQGLRVNKTDKTKSRILNKYDLTMILNDKTASGNIIGRVLLIDQDNTYVYNQRTERIEVDTKNFLPMFLYHMLNAPEQRKYIVKASQGNTQIYVNWSTISNIDYMIPQLLLEQEKIANLFSLINKDITLHQRKLEKLKLNKSALLQKLFPQTGCTIPDVRFKGFTDAWEQRKLKSIANTIVAGGDIDKNKIKESGTYPVIANALTKDGVVGYYEDAYRIEAPAVTVTGRGDIGVAKARHQNFTPVVRLLSLTTAHDVDFIEHAINNLKIVSESTGVAQLTVPQLSNYKIHITSLLEERKIGLFISKVDNLITLHQRKLDCLISIKKGLLQQLFV